MNEIIMTNSNEISTGSVKLDKAIAKISAELKKGNKSNHEIARTLYKIKTEELFTVTGYETFSDFAENYFGISKSQASRYTQVAEKFLGEQQYEDYTISQLVEMLKATPEMLEYINPSMSVKDIREYIKNGLALEDKDTTETDVDDTTETDVDDTPETDVDNTPETVTTEDGKIKAHFANEKELSAFLLSLAKSWGHINDIEITFRAGKSE